MNYKAAFHTLGCKVNSYETQAIKEQFFALGFEEAAFDEAADVYVVNTCSVTQVAERKSRQMLHRARKLAPGAVIAATGCYAQEDAKKLIDEGAVDIVVGNNEKSRLAEIVLKRFGKTTGSAVNPDKAAGDEPFDDCEGGCFECPGERSDGSVYITDLMHCRDYEEQKITSAGEHVRAYIKIQDGCNRFCSYCIIPYLRGRSRSRKAADIISEAKSLAANGYKEIIITGIDISDFEEEGYKKGDESLLYLLQEISKTDGMERIRLGSLECAVITENFMEGISRIPQFCPHFHLSLQSGAGSVLKRMNRKYTPDEYYEKVKLIRSYFPEAAVCTDIIAGFPGETEEEFEETCVFVCKVGFSRTHVFKYSKRKGTKAADMPGQIDGNIKSLRSEKLIGITDKLQHEYEEKLIGRPQKVLFEEKTGEGFQVGYTPEYVKIAVESEEDLVNRIMSVVPEGFIKAKDGPMLEAEVCETV